MKFSFLYLSVVAIFGVAIAHGPALSAAELQKRDTHLENARRSFLQCQGHLAKRSNLRREEFIRRHLSTRPLVKRQNPTPTQQRKIATGTNTISPFTGVPTCVLAPESVQGPYYLPGEMIRDDMRESQPGVDLLLDVQVYNAKTCDVMENVMMDFWHANATGSYGGYRVEGTQGETWLRGLAATNNEGVAQITTKWPGHYNGRAVHIHIMASTNGTIRTNGDKRTYDGGKHPFIGQLFFQMDTIDEISKLKPYSDNRSPLTRNEDDRIFNDANDSVRGYNGLMDMKKIGDNISDGVIAWISIGIDPGRDHDTGFPRSTGGGRGSSNDATTTRPGLGDFGVAERVAAVVIGAFLAAMMLL
ncbi:Intradiol ring-cleavage dioxygenase [Pyronema omphalodes]|nr:Intradiol ring-cleavage dioxygenase [Pyronema omphalodes]